MARRVGYTGVVHTCCHCGEPLDTSEYYRSDSKLFIATRHMPMCKACTNNMFRMYAAEYVEGINTEDSYAYKKALQRMCMTLDVYYSEDICKKIDFEETEDVFGKYLRMLNLGKNKLKCFDDTLREHPRFFLDGVKVVNDIGTPKIDDELVERWGPGLNSSDYDSLESHYQSLMKYNPNCDNNQRIFINDLCYIKMTQMKALREGNIDDFNKMTKTYRETFLQTGLKTAQDVEKLDDISLGVANSFIANYTPEEYYKDKKLYKDYDGIGDYIKRLFLRPLKNLKFGSKEQDSEYFVPDEDDGDE